MSTNVNVQTVMDDKILTGPNFLDWLKNLRIVLKEEKIAYVIIEPITGSPTVDAPESVQRAYQKCLVDSARAGFWEHYNEQAAIEGFKVARLLFGSKMEVGMSPMQYAL